MFDEVQFWELNQNPQVFNACSFEFRGQQRLAIAGRNQLLCLGTEWGKLSMQEIRLAGVPEDGEIVALGGFVTEAPDAGYRYFSQGSDKRGEDLPLLAVAVSRNAALQRESESELRGPSAPPLTPSSMVSGAAFSFQKLTEQQQPAQDRLPAAGSAGGTAASAVAAAAAVAAGEPIPPTGHKSKCTLHIFGNIGEEETTDHGLNDLEAIAKSEVQVMPLKYLPLRLVHATMPKPFKDNVRKQYLIASGDDSRVHLYNQRTHLFPGKSSVAHPPKFDGSFFKLGHGTAQGSSAQDGSTSGRTRSETSGSSRSRVRRGRRRGERGRSSQSDDNGTASEDDNERETNDSSNDVGSGSGSSDRPDGDDDLVDLDEEDGDDEEDDEDEDDDDMDDDEEDDEFDLLSGELSFAGSRLHSRRHSSRSSFSSGRSFRSPTSGSDDDSGASGTDRNKDDDDSAAVEDESSSNAEADESGQGGVDDIEDDDDDDDDDAGEDGHGLESHYFAFGSSRARSRFGGRGKPVRGARNGGSTALFEPSDSVNPPLEGLSDLHSCVLSLDTQPLDTAQSTQFFAAGCEDGTLRVIAKNLENVAHNDTPMSASFTGPLPCLKILASSRGPDCADVVVGGSLGFGAVVACSRQDGVTQEPLVLPDSTLHDSVLCCEAADINLDGRKEVIIGTYGQQLLAYGEAEEGSGLSEAASTSPSMREGRYRKVWERPFAHPLFSVDSGDFNQDGADELVVNTLRGVHVLRPDLHAAAQRAILTLQALEELRGALPPAGAAATAADAPPPPPA